MNSTPITTLPHGGGRLHNLFVYGTLLEDDIVRMLLQRLPPSSSAILDGYERFSIKGRVYPAIIPAETKKITGKVLLDITDPELDILDTYEDVEYEKVTVEVSLMGSSESLQAYTYVWKNKNDPNLYGDWDFEEWKQEHIDEYIKMIIGFIEEMELPEFKSRVSTYESFFPKDGETPPLS